MTNASPDNFNLKSEPVRPQFRVWLVQDNGDGNPVWTELSGLWPNKSGKGYHGAYRKHPTDLTGRIVILPASFDKKEPAA